MMKFEKPVWTDNKRIEGTNDKFFLYMSAYSPSFVSCEITEMRPSVEYKLQIMVNNELVYKCFSVCPEVLKSVAEEFTLGLFEALS
jgi:hypothetical protein